MLNYDLPPLTTFMEDKMVICYCRFIFAVLVIVFAWWHVSWAPIALTVLGALLAILALKRDWCCRAKRQET
jgi:hypothetical protein